jgi:hypothetical protein
MSVGDDARPRAEVDEVRWLPPEQADSVFTYERVRAVLAAFTADAPV